MSDILDLRVSHFRGSRIGLPTRKKAIKLKIGVEAVGTGLPTKTKIELEVDDGNWVDVTSLVRDYYQRQKITKSLIDKFVQDLASNNVNYEILLKAQGNLEKKNKMMREIKLRLKKLKGCSELRVH